MSLPYQLVVCDLDGTLVRPDLTISDAVSQTIAQVQQLPSVRFVLATGRMHPSAAKYARHLQVTTPIISYQGAMVRGLTDSAPLFHLPVSVALAQHTLQLADQYGWHLNLYINDVLYTQPHSLYVEEYRRTASMEPTIVEDLKAVLTEPSTKLILIENDPERLEHARQVLADELGDAVSLCLSRRNFLEITDARVNKWAAVTVLARQWNIPAEAILCIGDQENDLAMIRHAGCGVAMGNAPAAVQAEAHRVTSTVLDDGAATVLQEMVLFPARQAV